MAMSDGGRYRCGGCGEYLGKKSELPAACPECGHGMAEPIEQVELNIQPISFEEACDFVHDHHHHHEEPPHWKFGCAVNNGEQVVGVVTVNRPVARHYCDGWTLEVTRNCTDGTPNAASKLYAAAWRAARSLGYKRLITYTLAAEEDGTSLRAAGWEVVHETAGGGSWDSKSRPRYTSHPEGQKTLWEVNGNDPSDGGEERLIPVSDDD